MDEDQAVSAAVVEHQEHHQMQKAKKLARIPCVGDCLSTMQEVEMDTLTLAPSGSPSPSRSRSTGPNPSPSLSTNAGPEPQP